MAKLRSLTAEEIELLKEQLNGTCDSVERGIAAIGLDERDFDVTDVEDQLLNGNGVERCRGCDWWHESSELDGGGNDEDVGLCDHCRDKDDDE